MVEAMTEFLLELRSEEIPARMQVRAGGDLRALLLKALGDAGLEARNVRIFTGPRRLVFAADVPAGSPDVKEERKGPRVGSPEQALAGFLKAAGLSDISEAEVREDRKGEHYVAVIDRPGRGAAEIIADAMPAVMRDFPWPKSMRSGASDFRWVRPLRGIVALLDGEVVPFEVGGINSGNMTFGHRQHGPGPFTVAGADNYFETLEGDGYVVVDHEARKASIAEQIHNLLPPSSGLEWVEDAALLEENAGLTEWPQVFIGEFGANYLDLPEEVIRLTLKSHQKTFTVRDRKTGRLAPKFIIVANLEPTDDGEALKAGNAKVIDARLSDAAFFIQTDAKKTLAEHAKGLERVVFHDKLGSYADKVKRVAALSREIAPMVGADPDVAEAAARLAKADLVTGTVIEMTSLQGQIGRMMAEREGLAPEIALAIEEHYRPQGPGDAVPTAPVSVAVALADKLDSLVAFWEIDEKPTGSKDPYALRRAALGVVRTVIDNELNLPLGDRTDADLLAFIFDRLRVYLRDAGHRHDVIDAVLAQGGDDLLAIAWRVEVLGGLLGTPEGENLVQGYKRAANILRAERKKGWEPSGATGDYTAPEAAALAAALSAARTAIDAALEGGDYPKALNTLAALRAPIDAFFENVMVNSDDPDERERRLALLADIEATFARIADFGTLDG